MRRQDHATSAQRVFGTLSKWIGTRSQTLGGIFVCALAVYLVYGSKSATPSEVGFSLSMATGFSSQILFLVTTFNELEGQYFCLLPICVDDVYMMLNF
jgi:hypothetical protein